MIDDETINCWRINYGLDARTPEEAFRWWHEHMNGMAPAGAVAALGICLQEIFKIKAAAENILFKLEKSATITDADIRWLREAIK